MLLGQGYVPVISPIALGDDGQSYNLSADEAAAGIAVALGAQKLIYLLDAPGITRARRAGHRPLMPTTLERKARRGEPAAWRSSSSRSSTALAGGVGRVHVIDGRTPHSVIAELFTDRGVGTLVTRMSATTRDRRAARFGR